MTALRHEPTRPRLVIDGRRVGRYELRYELSSGGMGTVYLARFEGERGLVRVVAVKCLHAHLVRSRDRVDMFFDEARLASRIRHPHVCPVIDFGTSEGLPFLAMEYLVGETLASLSQAAGPLREAAQVRRMCRVLAEVAEGLHAAHELRGDDGEPLGVVHRDVTPRNLFVGYDGMARVVDFGVARAVGNVHRTETGLIKGTLGFVSPEALLGRDVDRRADLWALGVVAWQTLTGRRLFRREGDFETLEAILREPVQPPSRFVEGVPGSLDEVVLKALERDPERRWSTAREMSEALHVVAQNLGGLPHPGEVAQWMQELFPGMREHRDALERSVRAPLEACSKSRSWMTALLPQPHPAPVPDDESAMGAPPREEETEPHRPSEIVAATSWRASSASGARVAAMVAIALAALGGLGVGLGLRTFDFDATFRPSDADTLASAGHESSSNVSAAPAIEARADGLASDVDVASPSSDDGPTHDLAQGEIEILAADVDFSREGSPALEVPAESEASVVPASVGASREPDARRDRERGAMRTRTGGVGAVSVSARGGWVDIYHQGRHVGRTPIQLELPAGRQTLEVRPFGRPPSRRLVVFVPPGGETTAVVRIAD